MRSVSGQNRKEALETMAEFFDRQLDARANK
jgi:hypothetical protein